MSEPKRDLNENVGDESQRAPDVDTLVAALHSRSGAVRQRAREALVYAGKPAVDLLIEALRESDHQVQWEAAKALGTIADPAAAPALANQLDHTDFSVRWLAAEGLVSIGQEALRPTLKILAERGADGSIRSGAHHVLHGLGERGFSDKVAPILEALEGPDPDVRAARAARAALYGSTEAEIEDRAE